MNATKRLTRLWILLLIGLVLLAACEPGAQESAETSGGLQVWLDQPPDGASLPLAPFTLKAHARDDGGPGVQSITFLVNTVPVGSVATDPSLPLVYAETPWNPAAPGEYLIQAQAFNGTATASSDVARVCVGGECAPAEEATQEPTEEVTPTVTNTLEPGVTPSVTPTPTNTPTPTATSTRRPAEPTATFTATIPPVCAMAAPDPVSPPNGGTVDNPYPTLTWRYGGNCAPEGYRIDIATDPGMGSIAQSGGTGNPSTSWGPGQPLADCTTYYWQVAGVIGSTLGPYSVVFSFTTAFPGGCGGSNDKTPPGLQVYTDPRDATYYGSYCGEDDIKLLVYAVVTDDSPIATVQLAWRYRSTDGSNIGQWHSKDMNLQEGNTYRATIKNDDVEELRKILAGGSGVVEYGVTATDSAGNSAQLYYTISIYTCLG